ncbi:MAG: porin [Methylophilaceae bacterium]|nr:porin [Methylophilaceae bacterium]
MNARDIRIVVVALLAVLSQPAFCGEEAEDTQLRIRELERQIERMAAQIKALEAQINKAGAAPDAPRPHAVEASFKDGLVLSDASGTWSLRPYVRLQLDARHYTPDAFGADTFSMRRARLGVIGTFFSEFLLRIEGEYAEGNARLNDGYLEFNRWPSANLRLGQFKPYYGLERTQGAMDLDFMERALSDYVAGSVFDRGFMVHGEPLAGLYYHVAYTNGTGQNVDENDVRNDGKDISARLTGNIAQWLGWRDSVVHLGGWAASGRQGVGSAIPVLRTEGRGVTFFSTTGTSAARDNTFETEVRRLRYGFEMALAHGPLKFQGEYIHAGFDGRGFERDMTAWYASLQWLVTGEHYADFYRKSAFGRLVPRRDFDRGDGWGALELGLRYSSFEAGDFVASNPPGTGRLAAGMTRGADAWTLGAKWILNPNAQLQLNFVHTGFDTPITLNDKRDDREDALNMRVQFDF